MRPATTRQSQGLSHNRPFEEIPFECDSGGEYCQFRPRQGEGKAVSKWKCVECLFSEQFVSVENLAAIPESDLNHVWLKFTKISKVNTAFVVDG